LTHPTPRNLKKKLTMMHPRSCSRWSKFLGHIEIYVSSTKENKLRRVAHVGAFGHCSGMPLKIAALILELSRMLFETSAILLPTVNLDKLILEMVCLLSEKDIFNCF
jgi:hypothetical protein